MKRGVDRVRPGPDDDAWRQALRVKPRGFAPGDALRYSIAIAAALGIGTAVAGATTGVVMASGAFNSGSAGLTSTARRRETTMIGAGAGLSACAFLGSFTAFSLPLRFAVAAVAAFVFGALSQQSQGWGTVATQSLAGLIVFGRFPLGARGAALLAAEILSGCVLQILFSLVLFHSAARPPQPAPGRGLRGLSRWRPTRGARWHATRLAAAVLVAELLAHQFEDQRGYWIALTVIVVLEPDWATTVRRVLGRWTGTLAGVIPISIIATLANPRGLALDLGICLAAWATLATMQANYGLFCVFLSAFVVLVLDAVNTTPSTAAIDRTLDTTIGVVLALLVFRALRPPPGKQPAQLGRVLGRRLPHI